MAQLDPGNLEVTSFSTGEVSRLQAQQPEVSAPPMICSCFGSCDIYCGEQVAQAAQFAG